MRFKNKWLDDLLTIENVKALAAREFADHHNDSLPGAWEMLLNDLISFEIDTIGKLDTAVQQQQVAAFRFDKSLSTDIQLYFSRIGMLRLCARYSVGL